MNELSVPTNHPLGAARELRGRLRGLGDVRAPETLLPAVLRGIGLGDRYIELDTAIGLVFVAYNDDGVSAVAPMPGAAEFEARFRARFGRPVRRADVPPSDLVDALARHLRGEPAPLRFDLRSVSEFERAVLTKALEIPRGEVRTYGWIAREIGRPRAVRAVGMALGRNPIPLLIPCHRVVYADYSIGNYAFGTPMKQALLAAEGVGEGTISLRARAT
ncbi:MAG: MGMT family protein [Chloroflexota bacterium]|nr:MGMT family protein [Chloroflexota bacterium]